MVEQNSAGHVAWIHLKSSALVSIQKLAIYIQIHFDMLAERADGIAIRMSIDRFFLEHPESQ
jgi:hypothetical protein